MHEKNKKLYIVSIMIITIIVSFLFFFLKGEGWTTNEDCFDFDKDYQKITKYNFNMKGCNSKVKIPKSIGGIEVKVIGKEAFLLFDDGYTLEKKLAKELGEESMNKLSKSYTIDHNKDELSVKIHKIKEKYNLIENIEIPYGISKIEEGAFMFNNISSIHIPDSVERIGNWAFAMNNLSSIDIPKSVKNKGEGIFIYNNITNQQDYMIAENKKINDTKRISDLKNLRMVLHTYYDDEGEFPKSLDVSTLREYLRSGQLPVDPIDGKTVNDCTFGYKYELLNDNQSFRLSTCLESSENQIKSKSDGGIYPDKYEITDRY